MMTFRTNWLMAAGLCTVLALPIVARSADVGQTISAIKAVGSEGKGNEAAGRAVATLSQESVEALPEILLGFDGASALAANYLRSAAETIADRELADGAKLPIGRLEQFVKDTKRDPRARRLAYELILKADLTAKERIIPGLLRDPSPEFRRDAVARLIGKAEKVEGKGAEKLYQDALSGATDEDQVKAIAKALKDLGQEVNLVDHFGFLTQWKIIGPFNNKEFVGFDEVYPPEKKLDLSAKLEGQLGEVSWGNISTDHEFGIVDIAKSVSPYKGAVMYLTTDFQAQSAGDVEFRFGTPNAWKLWVNGKLIFGRDEYHRGMAIDQYAVPAKLKKGKNVILLKLCQNEQEDSWAQRYQIQIRVCDASGIAIQPAKAVATANTKRVVSAGGAN